MDADRRSWRQRWVQTLTALPLLALALAIAYRWPAPDWTAAGQRLVTSPYTVLALVVFVRYLFFWPRPEAPQAGRLRSLRTALYWLCTGTLGCVGAVGVQLFEIGWLEVAADTLVVVLSAASLGDGARRLTAKRVHESGQALGGASAV